MNTPEATRQPQLRELSAIERIGLPPIDLLWLMGQRDLGVNDSGQIDYIGSLQRAEETISQNAIESELPSTYFKIATRIATDLGIIVNEEFFEDERFSDMNLQFPALEDPNTTELILDENSMSILLGLSSLLSTSFNLTNASNKKYYEFSSEKLFALAMGVRFRDEFVQLITNFATYKYIGQHKPEKLSNYLESLHIDTVESSFGIVDLQKLFNQIDQLTPVFVKVREEEEEEEQEQQIAHEQANSTGLKNANSIEGDLKTGVTIGLLFNKIFPPGNKYRNFYMERLMFDPEVLEDLEYITNNHLAAGTEGEQPNPNIDLVRVIMSNFGKMTSLPDNWESMYDSIRDNLFGKE